MGKPANELREYGFTCFSCREMFNHSYEQPDYDDLENRAGAAGWCIGHWDGQGQIVCGNCRESIWDAGPLGTSAGREALKAEDGR